MKRFVKRSQTRLERITMKRLVLSLFVATALISSCGVMNQSATSSSRGIPTTFFNCALGTSPSFVGSAMDRLDYYSNWGGLSTYKVAPLGKRKIKETKTYNRVSYGGYTWQETTFLFDYRDRFFCIAFTQDFSNPDNARARFNEIKSTLDDKYGLGEKTQYGVRYGNPQGKCILLAVVPTSGKNADGAMCGLYYMDEKIYQTSTAAATDEL